MTLLHTCCLLVAASSVVHSEPGRVPKVYNALITSGQNLAPSKSFPVYQPFYQEAYGFPLPATYYFSDDSSVYKSFFAESPQSRGQVSGDTAPSGGASPTGPAPTGASRRDDSPPPPPSSTNDRPQEEAPRPQGAQPAKPPPPPVTQSPIPLNEFGLPPAIVPLAAGRPDHRPFVFTPFNDFTPYYPQLDYPDPYSFRSYPLLPPIYRFGGLSGGDSVEQQPPPLPQAPPLPQSPPTNPTSAAPPPPTPPPSASSAETPPVAPVDLSLNNYSGKDRSIPDVPPPPLPSGGFASKAKTN